MSNQQTLALGRRARAAPAAPAKDAMSFAKPAALAEAAAVHETAIAAAVAHVEAMTKAKFAVAMARPRDWELVQDRLLAACERPGFAERAVYKKPMGSGKFQEGLSIRFAEEAARAMGNLDTITMVTFDDPDKRKFVVTVMDLENNNSESREVVCEKTVERRSKRGRDVLGQRKNSNDDTVYIVRATDDELLAKQNSLTSKAERNLQLKFLPSDIADLCMETCKQTMERRDAKQPSQDQIVDKMLAAFDKLGVSEKDILRYCQSNHVSQLTTEEAIDALRKIHEAIKDGEATWQDYMDAIERD